MWMVDRCVTLRGWSADHGVSAGHADCCSSHLGHDTPCFLYQSSEVFDGAIWQNRPEKWCNNWILHHNNMPHRTSFTEQQFLANYIPAMPKRRYSPGLAACDFWLLPNLRIALSDCFLLIQEVEQNVITCLTSMPDEDFQRCFQQWQEHRSGRTVPQGWLDYVLYVSFLLTVMPSSGNFLILLHVCLCVCVCVCVCVCMRVWERERFFCGFRNFA